MGRSVDRNLGLMKVLVVGGTHAGVGKTTFAVGLMGALRQRGLRVQGFKVGPDLLDPLLHEAATGRASYNLDGWMLSREYNVERVRRLVGDVDVAIVEGSEGVFDGQDRDELGSTSQIAKWLGAPVVLVMDCASLKARSAAATLKGYLAYDEHLAIEGVVLNRTNGEAHTRLIAESIESANLGVRVFGAVHHDESISVIRDPTGRINVSGVHGGASNGMWHHGNHGGTLLAAAKAAAALHAGGGNSLGGIALAAAEAEARDQGPGGSVGTAATPEKDRGDGRGTHAGGRSSGGGGTPQKRASTFVTGVAAQLAHVVAQHVDLSALMATAAEFEPIQAEMCSPGLASPLTRRGHSIDSQTSSAPTLDDGGVTPIGSPDKAEATPAFPHYSEAYSGDGGGVGTPPRSPKRLSRSSLDSNGSDGPGSGAPTTPRRISQDSFGGKDLSKFPVIPESPTRGAAHRRSSDNGSPLPGGVSTPRREKKFGLDLVAALRPALRLGRGVSNSASSLIPRPFAERNTVRIGIARDAAFCHYFRENLALLEAAGADLVPFSPVAGDSLPNGCKGVLFGGGYPEMYASELTGNRPLRMAITAFAAAGGVIYGECGGLAFLSQSLTTVEGTSPRPMCGLAPFSTRVVAPDRAAAASTSYATVTVREGCPLFPAGQTARGQVFRTSELVNEPTLAADGSAAGGTGWYDAYDARLGGDEEAVDICTDLFADADQGGDACRGVADISRRTGGGDGREKDVKGYAWRNVLISYVRLHFGSNPAFARNFVEACRAVPAAAQEAALKAAAAARKVHTSTLPPRVKSQSMGSLSGSELGLVGGSGGGEGGSAGDLTREAVGSPTSWDGRDGSSHETSSLYTPSPMNIKSGGGSTGNLGSGGSAKGDIFGKLQTQHRRAASEDLSPDASPRTFQLRPRRPSDGGMRRAVSFPDYFDMETLQSFPPAGGLCVWDSIGGGDDDAGIMGDGHLHSPSCVPQPTPSKTCTIASLTPAATEIVHALGLQSRLVCVTDRCNFPPSVSRSLPIVLRSRSVIDGTVDAEGGVDENGVKLSRLGTAFPRRSSISTSMMNAARDGRQTSPGMGSTGSGETAQYLGMSIDIEWLRRVRPGLVLTQDACERCENGNGDSIVVRALVAAGLLSGARIEGGSDGSDGDNSEAGDSGGSGSAAGGSRSTGVLAMDPQRLSEVMDVIIQVGTATGQAEAATALVGSLRARLRAVTAAVSAAEHRPRVLSLEGLRPLAVGGHWLPEMKALAGGLDELQEPGAPAELLRWEQVLAYAPEVLILSPCVFTSSYQTLNEVERLAAQPGWWALPAVRARQVYVVHHVLFSRAGPRLVNGVELLAKILHPALAADVAMSEECTVLKLTLEEGRHVRPRQLKQYFKPWGGAGPTGELFSSR